jgi:hypothetical protein
MRAGEAYRWSNIAAGTLNAANSTTPNVNGGTSGFLLQGGSYMVELLCTGTPAMTLKKLGPDGSTFEAVALIADTAAFTTAPTTPVAAAGIYRALNVPPGLYEIVITTSTANYVQLTRIPQGE